MSSGSTTSGSEFVVVDLVVLVVVVNVVDDVVDVVVVVVVILVELAAGVWLAVDASSEDAETNIIIVSGTFTWIDTVN